MNLNAVSRTVVVIAGIPCFNDLSNASDDIVEDNFGDNSAISTRIRREYEKHREIMEQVMLEDTEESVKVLQQQTLQAVNRLLEDIHNVELQHPSVLLTATVLSLVVRWYPVTIWGWLILVQWF